MNRPHFSNELNISQLTWNSNERSFKQYIFSTPNGTESLFKLFKNFFDVKKEGFVLIYLFEFKILPLLMPILCGIEIIHSEKYLVTTLLHKHQFLYSIHYYTFGHEHIRM